MECLGIADKKEILLDFNQVFILFSKHDLPVTNYFFKIDLQIAKGFNLSPSVLTLKFNYYFGIAKELGKNQVWT